MTDKSVYRQDFEEFMRTIDFHEDAIGAQLEAFDKTWENDTCRNYLLKHVDRYRDTGEIEFGMLMNDAVLSARELGEKQFVFILLFDLCAAMYSYPIYEAKGLSREVWVNTMEDFRFKLNECRKLHGEWGTFVFWFGRFYTAECIAFNRLEFELETAEHDLDVEDLHVKRGQKVVNVHIPSNERIPLTKEECDKSYHLAAEYFSQFFDADEPMIFMCDSWMLHDAMRDFMPDSSNILRFASEYVIARRYDTMDDLWRIFYRHYDGHPEDLPEDTALQRGYKRHLMEGKLPGGAVGYRKHEKKEE